MSHPLPQRPLTLGMSGDDLRDKPYASFYRPSMGALSARAIEAIARGPVASPLLPRMGDAPSMLDDGDHALEDGFGLTPEGALVVAIRTEMPLVSPAMIDWWFGWHGDEPQRYKLWHPRAHVFVAWGDGLSSDRMSGPWRGRYRGRVSYVDEYLGSAMSHVAIRFLDPAALCFDAAKLDDAERATVIAARIGFSAAPLDVGYLIHHVRAVPGGSEMRSRFWLGGPHAAFSGLGRAGAAAARAVGLVVKPTLDDGRNLLVHCAEEMAHLASFLPALHRRLAAA